MKNDSVAKPKIIQVPNKKNGVTYLYEDTAFWNSDKKRGEHKRKCIGRLDADGNPSYNEYYHTRQEASKTVLPDSGPLVSTTTLMGQNLLLDKIVRDSALRPVLKEALGEADADKILQLARFSVCEGRALSRAEDWLDDRGLDGGALCSQRITELLRSLTDDRRNSFFKLWLAKQARKSAILFDITSISSYARHNSYVERGYNRDHENLKQINLGLLSAHTSNVPLWYSELPGSLADSVVLDHVLESLDKLGVKSITLVGDRGFYSDSNLKNIVGKGQKFTLPVPSNLKWQKELIDTVRDSIRRPANIIRNPDDDNSYIYGFTDYKTEEYGRTWRHVYFDPVKKEQDVAALMLKLRACEEELVRDEPLEKHKSLYETYFEVKETPKRGRKVLLREDAVDAFIKGYSGFWVILTNSEKDASKALEQYNRRCDIELHFDDMKNLLDCDRLNVHSEATMKGRLLVNFITLIVLTELRRQVCAIKPKDRCYWDTKSILNKVNTYSRIHFTGTYKDIWTVPTKAQRKIFDLFGIKYFWKGVGFNNPEPDKPDWDVQADESAT